MITALLNKDPEARPSCSGLLSYPMFNNAETDVISTLKSEVQARDEIIRNLQMEIEALKTKSVVA